MARPPIIANASCALAMMIKVPRPGASKTRLVPPLSSREAAELSVCFLRDTAANIAGVNSKGVAAGVAVYTPVEAERALDGLLPDKFKLLAQRGDGFGDRLLYATQDLLSIGYESLCLINSDSPTLPPALLGKAVDALQRTGDRLVLGPSADGGYYLIGLKRAHCHVFENIDWSTSRVLSQTLARAVEINLEVEMLPPWYDVDDADTLGSLCEELFGSDGRFAANGLVGHGAPHTTAYLARLIRREGRQRLWPARNKLFGVQEKTSSRQNDSRSL